MSTVPEHDADPSRSFCVEPSSTPERGQTTEESFERPRRIPRTHKVEVGPQKRGRSKYFYGGRVILRNNQGIYGCARYLLSEGIGSEDDIVELWRGSTLCLSGRAGALAKYQIREEPSLSLEPYRPHGLSAPGVPSKRTKQESSGYQGSVACE